jgi:hypothetical protein
MKSVISLLRTQIKYCRAEIPRCEQMVRLFGHQLKNPDLVSSKKTIMTSRGIENRRAKKLMALQKECLNAIEVLKNSEVAFDDR